MNVAQLKEVLDTVGVKPDRYALLDGEPDNRYCLVRSSGGWAVFFSERGNRNREEWFPDEAHACEYVLLQILRARAASVP